MGELRRAQELRTDEFSRNELGESHATTQELTSQVQELQERMNYMNDSTEFQDIESICSGKLSHVPSQPAVVPSPRAVSSRDQSLLLGTLNLSGTQRFFFLGRSTCSNRFITDTLIRNSSLLESKVLQVRTPSEIVQEDLFRKVKNNLEAQFHCRVLQQDHQP